MAWTRDQMCERAALELEDGYYCNLGIGLPTLVANFVPKDMQVTFQSENGMLGMGPFPRDNEQWLTLGGGGGGCESQGNSGLCLPVLLLLLVALKFRRRGART